MQFIGERAMTDRARELLERVLAGMDRYGDINYKTLEEIRAYLAEPEVKREALSEGSIFNEWNVRLHQFEISNIYNAFLHGVRFAEKHHGIGGEP